jgi:protein-S-isoprenylcysteine O-methyltransferase Ste14
MPISAKSAGAVKVILSLAFVAIVFVAAGTVRWTAFWVLLGFYVLTTGSWLFWLKRRDPGLLKERMTGGSRPDVKAWDRRIIRVYTVLLAAMLLLAPLDAVRFRWSRVPMGVQGSALLGLFGAWGLIIWVFRENAFLAECVRIQTDRGHTVCTTGPYRIVRHPMYVGVILTILCLPVLLGSLLGGVASMFSMVVGFRALMFLTLAAYLAALLLLRREPAKDAAPAGRGAFS